MPRLISSDNPAEEYPQGGYWLDESHLIEGFQVLADGRAVPREARTWRWVPYQAEEKK